MRWGLSAKKREDSSYFRGSHSLRPAPAADPYPAPAPCRTQGVRGAADTPPGTHRPASAAPARNFHRPERERLGGEKAALRGASLPVPPIHRTLPQSNTPARVRAGSAPAKGSGNAKGSFRKKAGRAVRISAALTHAAPRPPPTLTRHRHLAGRRGCGGRRTRPLPPTSSPPASHEFAPCLPRVRHLPPTSSPPASHEFATCLPRVRHRPSTSSPPAFHGLAPLPPTGPRPPYPRCQKPEYMVLRYCMGDIPVWRRKIR